MTLLDSAIVVALLAAILAGLAPTAGASRRTRYGALAVATLCAVIAVTQSRSQAIPAVAIGTISLLALRAFSAVRPKLDPRSGRVLAGVGVALLVIGAILAVGPLVQMPVWTLPPPSGPFAVGVRDFEITDPSRAEPFTEEAADRRRLMVRLWYPAAHGPGPTRPYRTAPEAEAIARSFGAATRLPASYFAHLRLVATHSQPNAPLSSQRRSYPVVIFSHGYLGSVETNTALMEHLASQGYFAFSVSHPYESAAVIYPDGGIVSLDPAVIQRMRQRVLDEDTRTLIASTDIGARFAATRRLYSQQTPFSRSAALWRDDLRSVLRALERGVADPAVGALVRHADLDRLAFAGMSFGGPAAANACHVEPRCRAAINLDGREQTLELFNRQIRAPLLMLSQGSQALAPGLRYNDFHYETAARAGLRSDVLRFIVPGSGHWDFTDFTWFARWPAKRWLISPTLLGERSGADMASLIDDLVLGFLRQYVEGAPRAAFEAAIREHAPLEQQDLSGIRAWSSLQGAQ